MSAKVPTDIHLSYLSQALDLARKSPPKPTNFRVGCVIVSYPSDDNGGSSTTTAAGKVLSTGYTLELPGNTHAEQCALAKLAQAHGTDESHLHELDVLSAAAADDVTLYTTLEPCGHRLSGNKACVERIIETRKEKEKKSGGVSAGGGIRKVVFGAREPGTFVKDSKSLQRLDAEGVQWEYVPGLEEEILSVAMEGHDDASDNKSENAAPQTATTTSTSKTTTKSIDDISPEERRRQEALPRNPKKRMMETV
ncbi:uncharacterized protein PV06_08947 [Exophiala oligosperma]|uniref:CMP/dCMP-type deaminase domain-containing protein n=1 Tax=Exophiala oligosperma TaxID=215243 RepID=A0A0D2D9M3_9EURO|nr:uncharacterized protein PV06_08947 [Exophiala oligosperma]KIW39145.1 hypothetical protein PV06_08947 [Exophiala oligosperma]